MVMSSRMRNCLTVMAMVASWATMVCAQEPPTGSVPPEKREDDRLGERLIRKAVKGGDEDPMDKITHMMGEAAQKLELDLDAGEDTQKLQRSVLEELDKAIKMAAAQSRPKSQPKPGSGGDKRESPEKSGSKKHQTAGRDEQGKGDSAEASKSQSAAASMRDRDVAGGQLQESRRGWGHLPDRDRDEIVQGINEGFVEKYRTWIERYYRALQENDN